MNTPTPLTYKVIPVRKSQDNLVFLGDATVSFIEGYPLVSLNSVDGPSLKRSFELLHSGDADDFMGVDLFTEGNLIFMTLIGSSNYSSKRMVTLSEARGVITVLQSR